MVLSVVKLIITQAGHTSSHMHPSIKVPCLKSLLKWKERKKISGEGKENQMSIDVHQEMENANYFFTTLIW